MQIVMNIDKEMECCYNCPFLVSASNTIDTMFICDINDYEIDKDLFYRHIKPATCPIVATLPDNHGRLIDADKIKIVRKPDSNIDPNTEIIISAIKHYIDIQPTVLERSKDADSN